VQAGNFPESILGTAAIGRFVGVIEFGTTRRLPIRHGGSLKRAFSWFVTPLLVAISLSATTAQAQDATWNFAPGSADYNTPTNWTPTAAPIGPSGTASFGASGTTSLTFSTGTTVDTFQFNSGAPAYTFGLNGHFLEFTGNGIVNNSSNAPTINASGLLQFDNTATAGNAIINNTPGATTFTGSSTAGTATITNSGGGLLSFTDSSTAGSATITTNAGSLTQFFANSDGGNARFVTNGSGIVDFSSTAGTDGVNIINTGSIAGSGRYYLGGNIVHVGGNGDTTAVSGVISACGPTGNECTAASGTSGGVLFKDGAGTLTLSGVNTYTGATIVNGGTLLIAGAGTLGATTAQLQLLAGTLDLGGTTQVTGELSTFGGSIVNGALNSTVYTLGGGFISASLTGGGTVTQDGAGATTLAATNTYAGGTNINSGTLEAAHVSGGAIDALSSGGTR
jgi:autotransporter-associated beta strand protein